MPQSNTMEHPFPSTASICFTAILCACLIAGSYRIALGAPFAIALLYMVCQATGMYRSVIIGVLVCLCIGALIDGDTFQSNRMFGHIGDLLYLPSGSLSCVAEMGPVTIIDASAAAACSTSSLLPEGDYVIRDVSFGDGLGRGMPHAPSLHPFYLIDTPDGPALVEVPARLVLRNIKKDQVGKAAEEATP
jgi:hypothetical protein